MTFCIDKIGVSQKSSVCRAQNVMINSEWAEVNSGWAGADSAWAGVN